MRNSPTAILWLCVIQLLAHFVAPESEHKSRVFDQDLSHEDHTSDGIHNPHYDQDALFGKAAEEFRGLSDIDKVTRLKTLFTLMDTDHDGSLSEEELRTWLKGNSMEQWSEYNLKPSEVLTWEVYEKHVTAPDGEYGDSDEDSRKKLLERDRLRWKAADASNDGVLTFSEASAFFNAEGHPHMHDTVSQETIDEMDSNRDGYIDEDEYIADLWTPTTHEPEEPEWIKQEREAFRNIRDKNKDGKLDKHEIGEWLFPPDQDYVEPEVSHLMSSCDVDKNGNLSEKEFTDCHEILIGSSATNYGELLSEHDEL